MTSPSPTLRPCDWCGRETTNIDRDGDPACRPGVGCLKMRAKLYEHNGERLSLREWAARAGMSPITLHGRLNRGMTIGEALALPVKPWTRARRSAKPRAA